MALVGDVNGDGFQDIVVGAPNTTNGTAYLLFGNSTGSFANISSGSLTAAQGYVLNGAASGDGFGVSVGAAGDINNDGFADFVVGATGNDSGASNAGTAVVFFGKSNWTTAPTTIGVTGTTANQLVGTSVKAAGDVNGDSFADMIVGSGTGTAYVVFGKASGWSNIPVSSLNGSYGFQITNFGSGATNVSGAGDVNGDGRADLIIGSGSTNAAGVIFGQTSFGATFDMSTLNGTNGFGMNGASGDGFGASVAAAGDINGDGFADVVIGAAGHDDGVANANMGAAYVIYGRGTSYASLLNPTTGGINVNAMASSTGFKWKGEANDDGAGWAVSGAGDVNGDGIDDFMVSARDADPDADGNPATVGTAASAGKTYIVFGRPGASQFSVEEDLQGLTGGGGFKINGVAAGDESGFSVSGGRDLNGDGLADWIIGARFGGATDTGFAHVMLGQISSIGITRIGTNIGQTMVGSNLNDTLDGKGGNDTLRGYNGDDILQGGAGNDTMIGGHGSDAYFVDSSNDVIIENGTVGRDTVRSGNLSLDLTNDTLYGGIENIILDGTSNLNGIGDTGNNSIFGNNGNNVLTGGGGNDSLRGNGGTDTYNIDGGDVIFEFVGGGTDQVNSSANYTLADQLENLTLTGSSAINGYGNTLANVITGNTGNNILDGGVDTVVDTLTGGGGNDTYVLRGGNDIVVDSGGVSDTITSTISRSLAAYANVDKLVLYGFNLDGTGNALNNTIIGTAGNNLLDGAGGSDILDGRVGNDTYVVDNTGDSVVETTNSGTDLVRSSVNVASLWNNVENVTLMTGSNLNATGNSLGNVMIGNGGANVFNGLGGNDTMTGGAGADTFVFSTAPASSTNRDTITDFSAADDVIHLENTGTGVFNALTATGVLGATAFAVNTTGLATTADQRIIYNSNNGQLFYDANGNAAGGGIMFAILTGAPTITNADFVVI